MAVRSWTVRFTGRTNVLFSKQASQMLAAFCAGTMEKAASVPSERPTTRPLWTTDEPWRSEGERSRLALAHLCQLNLFDVGIETALTGTITIKAMLGRISWPTCT